jgi:PilZ domain
MATLNKRKYKRFSATAFLNKPVNLQPLPPFFGDPIKGHMIDLSAGGMAILMNEIIPQKTKLSIGITFPNQTPLQCKAEVKRVVPRGKKYLIGFEFLNLPTEWVDKIERMSTDYIDCESRIQKGETEVCETNCSFFSMCNKVQRREPLVEVDVALEMAFKMLDQFPMTS